MTNVELDAIKRRHGQAIVACSNAFGVGPNEDQSAALRLVEVDVNALIKALEERG